MEKNLTETTLTDYDIGELYIRCVATFVEKCSKYELTNDVAFILGKKLWKETMEILKEYRVEHPVARPQAVQSEPPRPSRR